MESYNRLLPPRIVGLLVALLALLPVQVRAGELSLEEITDRLQQTYEANTSFKAAFSQKTVLGFNQRERQGQGLVTIEKSGRMRWDYEAPDRQVLVCDGRLFSMYIEKERQMIVGDAKNYLETDITYAFLSGTGKLRRDFDLQLLAPEVREGATGPTYHLKMTPQKAHPQVDFLEVWVNGQTFLIERILMMDHFASKTDIVFTNMRLNDPIPPGFFSFKPPQGTEIITQ